ncbi:TolC family outer membrane protein [Pandoraea terrae]|uniref:TolC family outer membrane protein n=1 Tax=Pandoraea terrae TaxID=1537710 RepID=UPI00177B6A58|nr:TolC family outer membrane protein [Pandoraea terrae]
MGLYRDALRFDPQFSSARAAHAASHEALPQARARLLPSLDIRGHVMRGSDINAYAADRNQKTSGYTVSLKQPLFHWGDWQTYQQGKLAAVKADIALAQANQDLMLRVSEAYFELLVAQDVASLAQAHLAAVAEQLAQASAGARLGNATIVDVHEAQATCDQAMADEIDARGVLEVRRSALAAIVGRDIDAVDSLRSMISLPRPIPGESGAWIARAELQAYGVQLGEVTLETARRETAKARAGHLPNIDLVASRERQHRDGGAPYWGGRRDASQIGVQIQIPIFAGFAVQSRVRETAALVEKARDELTYAQRTAGLEARKAHVGVTTGLMRVAALEAAEASARTAFESNRFGYQHHVRPNVDVLNAQYKLYRVRRELAQARYRTLLESLRLKASTASLDEADIAAMGRLLSRS